MDAHNPATMDLIPARHTLHHQGKNCQDLLLAFHFDVALPVAGTAVEGIFPVRVTEALVAPIHSSLS